MVALGHNVLLMYISNGYAISTLSGIPMAAAHVAGTMAYLISLPTSSPDTVVNPKQLKTDILSIATQGEVFDLPNDNPIAVFTEIHSLDSARQLTVQFNLLPGMEVATKSIQTSLLRVVKSLRGRATDLSCRM